MVGPRITTQIDIATVADAMQRLGYALDDEMHAALAECAEVVATEAAQHHPYQNQTQALQDNTRAMPTNGSFMGGTLASGVIADTEYATYVDGNPRFKFLRPAYDRMLPRLSAIIQAAANRAARKAGF